MLVALIDPVAGKMLYGHGDAILFRSAHIRACAAQDLFGIRTESPDIRYRIVKLPVDIRYRSKAPVKSQCGSLRAGRVSHTISGLRIACRRNSERSAERSSFKCQPVAPALSIGRQKQRYLSHALYLAVGLLNICRRPGTVHQRSDMYFIQHMAQKSGLVTESHGAEHLPRFFLERHL